METTRGTGLARKALQNAGGWLLALPVALSACATLESGRYGVRSLELRGARAVSPEAVESCLITQDRERFGVVLGLGKPVCNEPPFDSSPPELRLWSWPWAEWHTFNRAVLDHDLERVLRFYRARGYHSARIEKVTLKPEPLDDPRGSDACKGDTQGKGETESEDCKAEIIIHVVEGPPTLVEQVVLEGLGPLEPALQEELQAAVLVERGQPIDEVRHDRTKAALVELLKDHAYAGATVDGVVQVDTRAARADVRYSVDPGPRYVFGALKVVGHGSLPRQPIEAAAALVQGEAFSPEGLREVQREVFALGAFSAVEVTHTLQPGSGRADVQVKVTPKPPSAARLGFGVLSGATRRSDTSEIVSIPQWDLHLFSRYERRHVLGGLARLTVEERPRLIFAREFPKTDRIRFGNQLSIGYESPGRLEPRTTGFVQSAWDYGPDPFDGFFRSDVLLRGGFRRGFFARKLLGTVALQQDLYLLESDASTFSGEPPPSGYGYTYLEQDLRLDLRDDSIRPTRGFYLGLNAKEALRTPLSDWSALSLTPDARGYVPLPWGMVFAGRLALGALAVFDASSDLDAESQELGPYAYRLRGGGANSNRGFLPGTLGAGQDGGLRRWEMSLELRLPLGENVALVGFGDAGDVNRAPSFRFDHYNTSLGWGFRYFTPFGAIRLDVGYRIAAWQGASGGDPPEEQPSTVPFTDRLGAWHLTLGDSF